MYFGRKSKIGELSKAVVSAGGIDKFDWSSEDDRSYLRSLLMTASDIIAISKPWKTQYQVAEVIYSKFAKKMPFSRFQPENMCFLIFLYDEFFYQGDIEKSKDIKLAADMFNRDKTSEIPKFQIGFINFICLPVYEALDAIAPDASIVTERVKQNKQHWQNIYDGKEEPPIELPKKNKYGIYRSCEKKTKIMSQFLPVDNFLT